MNHGSSGSRRIDADLSATLPRLSERLSTRKPRPDLATASFPG